MIHSVRRLVPRNQIFALLFLPILGGCGGGAPDPTDKEVKALALDLCTDLLKNDLLVLCIPEKLGMMPETAIASGYPQLEYKAWKQIEGQSDAVKVAIQCVDEQMATLNMSLEGIRILSKDDDIGRTEFAAQVNFGNGNSSQIEGSAQTTEDDQIYVEVAFIQ